jgi:APA family basic amino acid/polyamine antiporter
MGIGATIGAGIFVLTGTVAANFAGPAVSVSFAIAGLACLCPALCYAEFSSISSGSGSAYTYTSYTFGEFPAWMVGWMLVLEYLFSGATVSVGWSGYFSDFVGQFGLHIPAAYSNAPFSYSPGHGFARTGDWFNVPAMVLPLILGLVLVRGVRLSSIVNNLLVVLKVAIVLSVIFAGLLFISPANWHPFLPAKHGFGQFGWGGVARGAGIVFFSYVGFDMVSTAAPEAKNPQRDIPIALTAALGICTLLYVCVALVVTGLLSYHKLDVSNPVSIALKAAGPALDWLSPLVGFGAVIGLASALMVTLYGQSRILLAIAQDGLLPGFLTRLHPVWRTPVASTAITVGLVALMAGATPLQLLGELASIGTLAAFGFVCIGVLLLDRLPDVPKRSFRTPFPRIVPISGAISCLLLMLTLPAATWLRLVIWCVIGIVVYAAYGYRSGLALRSERASATL